MDIPTSGIDGHTFTTSPEGFRLERSRSWAFGLAILIGVQCFGGFPDGLAEWGLVALFVIIGMIPLTLIGPYYQPSWLQASITVDGEYIHFVKGLHNRRFPLDTVRRIKIERALYSKHRLVTIWDEGGNKYTLLDPANGDALERWAMEAEALQDVAVSTRSSWLLTYEPFSTFAICSVSVAVGAIIASHLW